MKTVAKLFADLVAWRWAPAAGLLAASTLFVLVVVGLVPTEIGVPVANTKFVPRSLGTNAAAAATSETTTASFAAEAEASPGSERAAPTTHTPSAVTDFGKRGFSPRLDRPDAPTPAPPPAPIAQPTPVPPAGGGAIGGIFSRIQGALRPGGNTGPAAAAAAAAIASSNAANAANAANANAAAPAPADPNAPPPPGGPAAQVAPPPGAPPTPGAPPPYTPPAPGAGGAPVPPPQ